MADDSLSKAVDSLQLNGDANGNSEANKSTDDCERKWGFYLDELYKLALQFYKDKDGKALHISYKDKLKLIAYTKQVSFGKYRSDVTPEVGFLDVVGNDRRQAWLSLGEMSREHAMAAFVKHVDGSCPLFKPYVEAHKAEREEQERLRLERLEQEKRDAEERERELLEEQLRQREMLEKQKQLQQELQIRAALNQQTAAQFRQYSQQQYPNSVDQQEELIKQLQEQHFQQYMQQVYQQQLQQQQQQQQQQAAAVGRSASQLGPADGGSGAVRAADEQDENAANEINGLPPIAAASMWTRKDVTEFKKSLQNDENSLIKVGSAETVTVRVPTHDDGTCVFWEFASDGYDLGFGVFFEWTVAENSEVSVHVSESSDEEELEDEDGGGALSKGDVEKGSGAHPGPQTDEIIPVYRRDCHEEVYCGSHVYPGRGVYLLKFDNSYSLWRSKTLYYRVYYTR